MSEPVEIPTNPGSPRARAAVELTHEVQGLRSDVEEIALRLANIEAKAVTWPKLVAILGVSAATTIGAAWVLVTALWTQAADDVRQVRAETASQVIQVRTETAERLNRFEAKQDAMLQVVVEGAPRGAAQRELARRTQE